VFGEGADIRQALLDSPAVVLVGRPVLTAMWFVVAVMGEYRHPPIERILRWD